MDALAQRPVGVLPPLLVAFVQPEVSGVLSWRKATFSRLPPDSTLLRSVGFFSSAGSSRTSTGSGCCKSSSSSQVWESMAFISDCVMPRSAW